MEQSQNKECKKSYDSLSSLYKYSIVYDSFILKLRISISISTALLFCYCGERKIRTSFKIIVSKKTITWRLNKSHSNDKLSEKITSSSYHMDQKTFTEASCIYNIHAGENFFCSCCFWRFVSRLDSDRLKNLKCTLVYTSLLLLLQRRGRPIKYCLCEAHLISYM